MPHAGGEKVAAARLRDGAVFEAGADVRPVADDVVLHARVAFAQPLGPDVLLVHLVAQVAALKRPQREHGAGEVVERVAGRYRGCCVCELAVDHGDEGRLGAFQPVVDCHALELVVELLEGPEQLVDAVVEPGHPELVDQVADDGQIALEHVPKSPELGELAGLVPEYVADLEVLPDSEGRA